MSKSTKIIAGLGVAAALGVAALPLATFADDFGTHTVTVSANVAGTITAKAITGTNPTPVEWASTGTINFGNLAGGQMMVHGDTTVIDVETNYPNGYVITATAEALENTTGGSGTIGMTDGYAFTGTSANKGTYNEPSSAWGVKVTKTAYDYTESDWSSTPSALSADSDYSSSTFISKDTGTVDTSGTAAATFRNKYDINYGIGIASNQASGIYSGEIAYTLTATDYDAN
ncbi:hypothetical protein IKG73_01230 [Candidatus Saccharibacteria bacterium]|nr:hypothetical protein [Candidatus Saccharibacteria bacterium]